MPVGRLFVVGASVAIVVTAVLGVWLRLVYAGAATLPLLPAHWRHAHSHAGVYAVFFPLVWLAWRHAGLPIPGARTTTLYFVACALAVIAFAIGGYFVPSIVGSSVVGAIWLFTAWSARRVVRDRRDALRLAPLAIVLGTAFIPAIAVTTRRDPALANALVHAFLSLLFFLLFVPAALARVGASPEPRALALFGTIAALHLGPLPHLVGALALASFGGLVAWSARRTPLLVRGLWLAFALGTCAMLAYPSGPPPMLAVAGLHFLLLGPVFVSFVRAPGTSLATSLATWVAAYSALAMGAALVMEPTLGSHAHTIAAISGVTWALGALGATRSLARP